MIYPYLLFFIPLALLLFLLIKKQHTSTAIHPKLIISQQSHSERLLPLILILIIIALARPIIPLERHSTAPSTPIFIAIDASNSMRATDITPDRLHRAFELAHRLIDTAPHKIALLIFTKNPLLIAPPTTDKQILHRALKSFDPSAILTKGTDFQRLLDFVHRFEGKKKLVIISDGGEFKKLHTYDDIDIYAVILGTKEGALIPTDDGYLKDESGKLVVTRINPAFASIAKKSFYNDIDGLLSSIDTQNKNASIEHHLELYFIPLLLALIVTLAIYTTLFDRFKKLIPLLLFAYLPLHAGILDELRLKKGYALYDQKRYKEALRYFEPTTLQGAFAKATTYQQLGACSKAITLYRSIQTRNRALKATIFERIGACYEKMHRFDAARRAYIQAAQLAPTKERIDRIAALVFKHDPQKPIPPFSKQKHTTQKSKQQNQSKRRSGGASLPLAAAGGAQKGQKKRSAATASKSEAIPLSSKVYELINKGYIDEKDPW